MDSNQMSPQWLPIRYRDFYDFPRAFVVEWSRDLLFFDCPFNDALDDYDSVFTVFKVRGEFRHMVDEPSWERLRDYSDRIGIVPARAVTFDETKRQAVDASLFSMNAAKPAMQLREDAEIEVVVSSVAQFGVLVDFNGGQGVVLVPNIYWDYHDAQRKMTEDFKPGQKLTVKVLVAAPKQFSASIKHMHPEQNPWKDPSIYARGTVHDGVVRLIFDHGPLLVKLENGAEIVVPTPKPGIGMNDRITVRVTDLDIPRERIKGEQM